MIAVRRRSCGASFPKPASSPLRLMKGRDFRIVGVIEQRGTLFSSTIPLREVFIPIKTAIRINPDVDNLYILCEANPKEVLRAVEDIEDLMRLRRQVGQNRQLNFTLNVPAARIEKFKELTSTLYMLTICVASITLLIGGFGVMNIMLVSVTSRTKEIGLRKTVGAKSTHILIQFILESSIMTGIGGILGIACGWLLTILLTFLVPSNLPIYASAIGLLISIGVGVIFGSFPAWKASKLHPVDALRYE